MNIVTVINKLISIVNVKLLIKSLIVVITITLFAGFALTPAFAHSENYVNFFTSATQYVCYATGGLGFMQYEGSTGQGSTIKTQIEQGMSEVSDNTDMNIYTTTNCSSSLQNWVTSFYHSDTSKSAKVSVKYTTLGNEYKMMEYNRNTYIYWVRDGGCSSIELDLSNMANHEFGHFAGSPHQSGGASHTMMGTPCNSGYSSIKTADVNYINGGY